MRCLKCKAENPDRARFCLECGASFGLRCTGCGAELPSKARFCLECGRPVDALSPTRAPEPRSYTPKHLAEKILTSRSRPRRRAQAGDGALRRREGLDGARRAGRSRGVAPDHGPLLRDPLRRRPSLRGHGQPVHRRRHHGALRRADRARGPRAARLLRGAAPARRAPPLRATSCKRARGSSFSVRMGLNSGEVVVGQDRRRPADGLHGAGAHGGPRGSGWSSWPRPGDDLPERAHARSSSRASSACATSAPFELKGVSDPVRVFELEGVERAPHAASRSRARAASLASSAAATRWRPSRRRWRRRSAGTVRWSGSWPIPGSARAGSASSSPSAAGVAGSRCYEAHGVSHGKAIPFLPILELFRGFFGITEQDSDQAAREKIAGRLLLLDEALPRRAALLRSSFSVCPIRSTPLRESTRTRDSASSSPSSSGWSRRAAAASPW